MQPTLYDMWKDPSPLITRPLISLASYFDATINIPFKNTTGRYVIGGKNSDSHAVQARKLASNLAIQPPYDTKTILPAAVKTDMYVCGKYIPYRGVLSWCQPRIEGHFDDQVLGSFVFKDNNHENTTIPIVLPFLLDCSKRLYHNDVPTIDIRDMVKKISTKN